MIKNAVCMRNWELHIHAHHAESVKRLAVYIIRRKNTRGKRTHSKRLLWCHHGVLLHHARLNHSGSHHRWLKHGRLDNTRLHHYRGVLRLRVHHRLVGKVTGVARFAPIHRGTHGGNPRWEGPRLKLLLQVVRTTGLDGLFRRTPLEVGSVGGERERERERER